MASPVWKETADNLDLTKINSNESSSRQHKLITRALINAADTSRAIIVVIVALLIDTAASVGIIDASHYWFC